MALTNTLGVAEGILNTVPAVVHFWADTSVTGWLTLSLPVATVITGPVSHVVVSTEEVQSMDIDLTGAWVRN
jgi:hypothetical protein